MKRQLSVLLLVMLFYLAGCGTIENSLQSEIPQNEETKILQTIAPKEHSTQNPVDENSTFFVHYIDVGQADAALVLCDNKTMLIDGGNSEDSNIIVAYLKKLNINYIDYMICSHAHEDHVGGLCGPLSVMSVGKVYAPNTESISMAYSNFKRKAADQGLRIQHPTCGDSFNLGSSTVKFLGPVNENDNDLNNTSIVLKITYGDTSFLFTGDAEQSEENDIMEQNYDLSATVLKVGHHGSEHSTSYMFLREVMPKYAVISVGKNNEYGHPDKSTLIRLMNSGAKVFRTDLQGDIVITSNGKTVSITPEKNANIDTINITTNNSTYSNNIEEDTYSGNAQYIGNINTKKFHLPSCRNLPKESNSIYFSSRDEAINSNYTPCGNCNP